MLLLPAASQPQDVLGEKRLQDLRKSFTARHSATFTRRGNIKGCLNAPSIEGKKCRFTFLLESLCVWQNADHDAAGRTTHWPFVASQNVFKHESIPEKKKKGAEKQFLWFFFPPIYNNFLT